jgi:hypothetical protein
MKPSGLFRASAPAGASTGVHEAVELRDGDNNAYMGKGMYSSYIPFSLLDSFLSTLQESLRQSQTLITSSHQSSSSRASTSQSSSRSITSSSPSTVRRANASSEPTRSSPCLWPLLWLAHLHQACHYTNTSPRLQASSRRTSSQRPRSTLSTAAGTRATALRRKSS